MKLGKDESLALIRQCLATDRYRMTLHFRQRMGERGLVWADVLAVVSDPADVRYGGQDEYDRDKWIICGQAGDGLGVELVCVMDVDMQGHLVVLVTIYTV